MGKTCLAISFTSAAFPGMHGRGEVSEEGEESGEWRVSREREMID